MVLHSVMPMEAEKCARMYETSGKQAVQDYLDELQRQKSVRFYFFDEDGNSLLDRGAPELIRKMALNKEALQRTEKQNLSMVSPKDGIAMRLVQAPSGRKYNLAFQQSPTLIMPVSQAVGTHPYLRLAAIGLFGALLCFLLTRNITKPISRLRVAASEIAAGKFKTRVDPSVRRRYDESGVELAQRETFDLTNLLHEVAADGDFEARARKREVKIVHADNCTMSGAPEMLRSAIENVVRNAIRHTLEGTSVELTLKQQRTDSGETAVLETRDHGPGVPKWMLSEIFLPFHRVTEQSDGTSPGAGLGLAIADRVVRMHQGSIRALNAPDGGLIVEIGLPIGSEARPG